jgi:Carboxypeptidase regulatory-like domain
VIEMLMKTVLVLPIAHFLVLAFAPVQADSQSAANNRAQLSGAVADISHARIVKAKVILESDGRITTVSTQEDGTFDVRLLPGVYKATIIATGFCPLKRAKFRLAPSDNVKLNFVLSDCPFEHTLTFEKDEFKEESSRYKLPFKEESIELDLPSSLNLLVQFGKRSERKSRIEYQGFTLSGGRPVPVTATYNFITLQADLIKFDRKTLRLEAQGNVLVEDGKEKMRGNHAILKLTNKHPQINVRP